VPPGDPTAHLQQFLPRKRRGKHGHLIVAIGFSIESHDEASVKVRRIGLLEQFEEGEPARDV